ASRPVRSSALSGCPPQRRRPHPGCAPGPRGRCGPRRAPGRTPRFVRAARAAAQGRLIRRAVARETEDGTVHLAGFLRCGLGDLVLARARRHLYDGLGPEIRFPPWRLDHLRARDRHDRAADHRGPGRGRAAAHVRSGLHDRQVDRRRLPGVPGGAAVPHRRGAGGGRGAAAEKRPSDPRPAAARLPGERHQPQGHHVPACRGAAVPRPGPAVAAAVFPDRRHAVLHRPGRHELLYFAGFADPADAAQAGPYPLAEPRLRLDVHPGRHRPGLLQSQALKPHALKLHDLSMSLTDEVARRRTFAIISHPDAGKTTLTEKLLLFAGAIQIAGSVKARKASRHAASDWMEIEKQRGISVASSVMQMEYRDCVINLLDTPGHQDFSEDTYRVLTAVDAAVMVIDAGNGVVPQTVRLMQVCRARDTPIMTCINKLVREVREPLDVLAEIEGHLGMDAIPFSWPVGMGRHFGGVFDLRHDRMRVFRPGSERHRDDDETIDGLNNPELSARFGDAHAKASEEIELITGAVPAFDHDAFLAGRQTPVFFGSAINNFGVREVLDALVELAPPPGPRAALERSVLPSEPKFTGVVFKVQANMDPAHRDRVAFVRVSSGRFERGMRLKVARNGKEI